MDGVLGWVVRWRVAVLVAALVSSFVVGVAGLDGHWLVSLVWRILLPFGLLLYSSMIARTHHPAVLVARPPVPALEVPPNPWMVLGAAGYTLLSARLIGEAFLDDGFSVGIAVFAGLCTIAFWTAALGRFGVRLYPEGIASREVFGSVFVPWEALGGPRPAFAYHVQQVTLTVADPARIRRRGLRFGDPAKLSAAGVSAELLARAIHEYANRPELRPAIGTEEELARFQRIPQIAELTGPR